MKFLTFLFMLSPLCLRAQVATFKEIRMPSGKLDVRDTNAIIYPIIVLKDVAAAATINKTIKRMLLDDVNEDSTQPVEAALKQYADDYLLGMEYKTLFNKNGILSIEILLDVQGAYEHEWQQHFNFNLSSGKLLTISDIVAVNKPDAFKAIILKNKQRELEQYFKGIKQELADKDITRDDYERYLQLIKDGSCMDSVSLEKFSLTDSVIQVYDDCNFPHNSRNQQPYYNLKYNILHGRDLLRKDIVHKLTGK